MSPGKLSLEALIFPEHFKQQQDRSGKFLKALISEASKPPSSLIAMRTLGLSGLYSSVTLSRSSSKNPEESRNLLRFSKYLLSVVIDYLNLPAPFSFQNSLALPA